MLWAVAVLAVVVLGIIGGTRDEERPGSPAEYRRIESLTDCGELQAAFDEAESGGSDAAASYMRAADDRMRALGCYG